jgi:hypothetical protein
MTAFWSYPRWAVPAEKYRVLRVSPARTRSAQRVAENVAAAHLTFTSEGLDLIGSLLPNGAAGDRYPAPMMPAR